MGKRVAATAGGYINVQKDKTTIIADSAEWPDEIDVERGKRGQGEERRLKEQAEGLDIIRAEKCP